MNLNIQSARIYYNPLTYMTAYFANSEGARTIKNQKLNMRDAMKTITYSFISTRQLSL